MESEPPGRGRGSHLVSLPQQRFTANTPPSDLTRVTARHGAGGPHAREEGWGWGPNPGLQELLPPVLHDYTNTNAESVIAAVADAISRGEELVAGVVGAKAPRTWDNTLAPLDRIGAVMVRAYGVGPFMGRAHPDRGVREAAQAGEETLSKWQSDLVFRRDLYEAIESYAATKEAATLPPERQRFLEFIRRDFRRAAML